MLLVLAPAAQTHAQQDKADEAALFREVPTVFGASRYEQPLAEAPSSVSVVTADDIRRFGYRTLAEILSSVNGFFSTDDRNYTYLGVRGFARTGDFNSRMQVQIDGHAINDPVYGTASLGNDAMIDVSMIERVEVIRGPTSSLYGPNAVFGVVNVVTRRGRDLDGSRIAIGLGSSNSNSGQFSTGRRLDNGLEYLVSASAGRTDGMRRIHYPELDSPVTNNGIARNVDWERNRKVFTKLRFENLTATGAFSTRTRAIPTGAFGTVFNDAGTSTTDDEAFLDLQHVADLGRGQLRSRVSYDDYDYTGRYVYDFPPRLTNFDTARGKRWGLESVWSGRIASNHKLTLGGEWRHSATIDQRNYDATLKLDDRRKQTAWGAYLQDEWRISELWIANIGLRHDQTSQFGSSVNPRAALIFLPRATTTLKLLSGRAFRPPNAYELYYNDGNVTQKANTALRAETVRTSEIVLEERFAPGLRGTLNVYRYRIDNLITQRTDPADGLLVFVNQESVDARGIEAELERKWDNGAIARVAIASQSNRDSRTGTTLIGSPRTLAKTRLAVPVHGPRWFAGIEANYIGARSTLAGNTDSSFWLSNLTLTGDRVLPGTRASLGIYNLTNRRYADPGAPEHRQDQIGQTGRTIFGRVEIAF